MIDLNGKLGLHARFRHEVARIGNAQAPVLIVDDFLSDPHSVIEHAATGARFAPSGQSYPGLRAVAPPIYAFAVRTFLVKLICNTFGIEIEDVLGGTCDYSLVTTPPDRLHTIQRLPHFDGTNIRQIATVHYLCPAEKGGTSFYRHRGTGYEVIDSGRVADYTRAVEAELKASGPPPLKYIDGNDAMYERIAAFDAVFNRVLIYRSANLHSASIGSSFSFDANPRTGRLTANAILTFR